MKNIGHKKLLILIIIISVVGLALPSASYALNVDYPAVPAPGDDIDLNCIEGFVDEWCDGAEIPLTISNLVGFIFAAALWLGGLIAFGGLLYVGYSFVISGASPGKHKKALEDFKGIMWGIGILLFSVILLNTINPDILNIDEVEFETLNITTEQTEIPETEGLGDEEATSEECAQCLENLEESDDPSVDEIAECSNICEMEDDSGSNQDGDAAMCREECLENNPGEVLCNQLEPCPSEGVTQFPPGMQPDGVGYYKMPKNQSAYLLGSENSVEGRYGTQLCGSRTLLGMLSTAISEYNKRYPEGPRISIGDLNAGPPHSSHALGADVDIYGENSGVIHINGDKEKTVFFGKRLIDTGVVYWIFYEDKGVRDELNAYARETGKIAIARCARGGNQSADNLTCDDGHHNHFHVRIKEKYAGGDRGNCSFACGQKVDNPNNWSQCSRARKW